jgi:hypothetical protein
MSMSEITVKYLSEKEILEKSSLQLDNFLDIKALMKIPKLNFKILLKLILLF